MSEQVKTGGEDQKVEAIDLTKYVPKEEVEKLSTSVKELETKLDEAKLKLLEPDYIEFQQAKQNKVAKQVATEITDDEAKNLSPKQIIDKVIEKMKSELLPEYDKRLQKHETTLQHMLAIAELQEVEKKYTDFNDFRPQIQKILETSTTDLTIEQAYKLAKADVKTEKTEEEKLKGAKAGAEKPSGTVPGSAVTPKSFKDNKAAAEDAWDKIVGNKDTI